MKYTSTDLRKTGINGLKHFSVLEMHQFVTQPYLQYLLCTNFYIHYLYSLTRTSGEDGFVPLFTNETKVPRG